MKKVYIVIVDGYVSQEGYDSLEKAEEFIMDRADKPTKWDELNYPWAFKSENHIYTIKEISIK